MRASHSTAQFASLSTTTGQPEPLGHHLARTRCPASGSVDRLDGHPGARIERAGDAEADRLDRRPTAVADLLHRVARSSARVRPGRGRRPDGWYGDGSLRSASTAPARSLVPPRSTPMTQPSATSATIPLPAMADARRPAPVHALPRAPEAASPRRVTTASATSRATTCATTSRSRRGAASRRRRAARSRSGASLGYVARRARRLAACSRCVLFLISAQIQRRRSPTRPTASSAAPAITLTSPNTILVLGSDARMKGQGEPGAQTIGQPRRSDSIMLHADRRRRATRTLSIPRDTVVDIPGHGRNKINAAYAFGGPALAINTVEQYLGIHDQPPGRGQLRELPAADRRARRHHLHAAAAWSPRSTAAPRTAARRCG